MASNSPFDEKPPGFPQQSASLGAKPSAFGQQASAFGQQTSAFGQQTSGFGQKASAFGQQQTPFSNAAKPSWQPKSAFGPPQQQPSAFQLGGAAKPSEEAKAEAPKSAFGGAAQPSAFQFGGAAKPSEEAKAEAPKSAFGGAAQPSAFQFGGAAKPSEAAKSFQKPDPSPQSEAARQPVEGEEKPQAASAVLGKEPPAAVAASNKGTAFLFNQQVVEQEAKEAKEAKSKPSVFGAATQESKMPQAAFPAAPTESGAAKPKRTAQDLQVITGLKKQYAEECFLAFGCYEAALASFAQSFLLLPKDLFDAAEAVSTNARTINEQLRTIYQKAREVIAGGAKDADAWKHFQQSPASLDLNAEVPVAATATAAATAAAPAAPFSASFGFGVKAPAANSAAAAPAAFVGFGEKAPAAAAPSAGATSSSGFGGTAATASAEAAPEKEEKKAEVIYCAPEHFTGPFFDMAGFWETEVMERCALLNLNGGFIESNRETLLPRLEKWVRRAGFYRAPVRYAKIVDRDEEVTRVIIKDADRTFNEPQHREKLVQFLHAMYHEFNAYGQAMSYLAGLCMLVLNEDDTAAVLRFVSKEHIRGHWAAEAVGFATSAWVVNHYMEKRFPEVAHHLMELQFWPDTYLQKILTGLCIHVLPFQELFVFLDAFMAGGMAYLIKFCLSIVERFQGRLLAIKDSMEANKMYEIMRLDSHATNITDVRAILARAPEIELGEDEKNIDVIRSDMYEKHVLPRLQKAPKKDTFEPCALCEKDRPKWWSDDLGHVCDACKEKHPNEHFEAF